MAHAAGYNSLLRRLSKWRGKKAAWSQRLRQAARYRDKLVRANRHYTPARPKACQVSPESRAMYAKLIKTKAGRAVAKLFKRFWGLSQPPTIVMLPGGGKQVIPLMGMGVTEAVYLSSVPKGKGKRYTLKGKWYIASDAKEDGKSAVGKRVAILSGRNPSGKWVPVGYAEATRYIPTPDLEACGTHKAHTRWHHKHGVDDKKQGVPKKLLHWPRVYADRNGKVDKDSNFIYGATPTAVIEDWMYG